MYTLLYTVADDPKVCEHFYRAQCTCFGTRTSFSESCTSASFIAFDPALTVQESKIQQYDCKGNILSLSRYSVALSTYEFTVPGAFVPLDRDNSKREFFFFFSVTTGHTAQDSHHHDVRTIDREQPVSVLPHGVLALSGPVALFTLQVGQFTQGQHSLSRVLLNTCL